MQDRFPYAFRATVTLVGVTGFVLVAIAAPRIELAYLLGFVTGAALLEGAPARLRQDVMASLSTVATFTAIIVGGWELAVVSALGVGVAVSVRHVDRRIERGLFNFGQFAISAAAAAWVFELVRGDGTGLQGVTTARGFLALAMAAFVATLVNHVLVAIAVRLTMGDPVRDTLRGVVGTSLLLQYLYLGFSVVAAALILEVHPATLVLLVVPAVVARRGLLGFQAQAEAYDSLVAAFVKVIEVKDPYTRGHAERVATLSEAVAGELGHDYETRRLVRYAAVLHDVGKVGIPSAIINKPGALDHDEREIIKRHPEVGAEMLRDITFLQPALDIVRCHHERLDGAGYPFGVPGEQLSPLVRIVTAVDAFDAMTSTRSYRRALTVEEAISELRQHVGSQFDGAAVEGLAVMVEKLAWRPTTAFASADELVELESRRRELDDVLYPSAPAGRVASAARDGAITGIGA